MYAKHPYLIIVTIFIILALPVALAHFSIGGQTRQFVISETKSSTEIYIRTPIALLFGDVLSGQSPNGAKFLINRGTKQKPVLFLSTHQIGMAPSSFTQRLTQNFTWYINGQEVFGRVRDYRVMPHRPGIPLTSVAAGKKSLSHDSVQGEISIGSGHIDLLITLPNIPKHARLTLQSGFPPIPLAAGVSVDNHFTDVRGTGRLSYTRPGQLERSIALPRSELGMFIEYVYQGFLHILEGFDHVLLVVVMTLSTAGAMMLIRAVTAFTLGHAVTLAFGFLGYTPQVAWFIPAVEAAIAATIFITVILSYWRISTSSLVYITVGLLHGFGFSFVLGNLLGRDSSDLIPALFAFTIGIEIGQLAIVVLALILLAATQKISIQAAKALRFAALGSIGLFAFTLTIMRIPAIFAD